MVTDENRTAADGDAGAHVFRPLLRRILTPSRVFGLVGLRLVRARLHQDQSNVTFKCLFCGGGRGHASSDASHPPTRGHNTDGDRNTIVDEQKTRQQQPQPSLQAGGVDGGPTRLSEQEAETLSGRQKSRQRTRGRLWRESLEDRRQAATLLLTAHLCHAETALPDFFLLSASRCDKCPPDTKAALPS